MRFCLLPVILLPCVLPAQTEESPLITDRPDVTESSATVPPGVFQLESGGGFSKSEAGGTESFTIIGTLARLGVGESMELRAGSSVINETTKSMGVNQTRSGFGGLLLGGKIRLLDEGPGTPETAILAHVHLPVSEDVFRPRRTEPEVIASVSKPLSESVSFGSNIGARWNSTAETPVYVATGSFGIGLSDRVGIFVEYFAFFQSGADPSHNADGGLAWQPWDRVQLDFSAGLSPFETGGEWFVGTGVSFRVPQ